MRGTGPVKINGTTIYAYYTLESAALRVRISVDEADRVGITEGLRVKLTLPGQETADVLVIATTHAPPYVWLHLEPLATRAANRAG